MALMRVRDLLVVACAFPLCAACPFGGEGPVPHGHPSVDGRRLSTYPGYLVDSYADSGTLLSSSGPGAPSPWPTTPSYNPFLDALAAISADMGDAELCYWSWQTLPGPKMRQPEPSVSLEDVNLWFENTNNETTNFADMAVKRMQSHVTTDGVVVWTGCSVGSTLRKAMCDNNKALSAVNGGRLEDCALDAVYNQTLMIPTAIVIFKFRSSTIDQLKNFVYSWRTEQGGHVPQMTSTLVNENGWGTDGQTITKTVPCSQIPEKFKYQNLGDCDEMGDNGMLLADEAFQVWSSLCSVTKDNCPSTSASASDSTSASTSDLSSASIRAAGASVFVLFYLYLF